MGHAELVEASRFFVFMCYAKVSPIRGLRLPLTVLGGVSKISKILNNKKLQMFGGVAQVVRAYGSYP